MSKRTVVYYEAGRIPDLEELWEIAKAGGRPIEWILKGEQHKTEAPPEAALLVKEAPVVYQSLLEDAAGDRRLLRAIENLIAVVHGPDQQAAEWLIGNITVFAERARNQLKKRKRRAAG